MEASYFNTEKVNYALSLPNSPYSKTPIQGHEAELMAALEEAYQHAWDCGYIQLPFRVWRRFAWRALKSKFPFSKGTQQAIA